MPRRGQNLYSLKRKRIRASYSKVNVYNAFTWRTPPPQSTQFRQVFKAKQETRAYHGERLSEKQFRNHFMVETTAVSPLQRTSEDADKTIPYALQTFVSLERRLDVAIFRAMFASSAREAAQFVLAGHVKVNGVRMRSAGYTLRRGDVFSVDPEIVLKAMGRGKPSPEQSIKLTNNVIRKFNKYLDRCHAEPEKMWEQRKYSIKRHKKSQEKFKQKLAAANKDLDQKMQAAIDSVTPRQLLQQILTNKLEAKNEDVKRQAGLIAGLVQKAFPTFVVPKSDVLARAEAAAAKLAGTTEPSKPDDSSDSQTQVSTIVGRYFGEGEAPALRSDVKHALGELVQARQEELRAIFDAKRALKHEDLAYDPTWVERLPAKVDELEEGLDYEALANASVKTPFTCRGKPYGLAEPSKTYFTPWQPREFVAPMAVLPHHLEIEWDICHAVYLRDPSARPDHSEVISPFPLELHENVRTWYHRRRLKRRPRANQPL